ncbi:hypothetical protein [Streptomyces sp. NPDC001851]|uniref:hypothetical protein n=1 Tax=Streptomyces sp. NPDC001851 TaxID=3154529 RepID=UPI00332E8A9C
MSPDDPTTTEQPTPRGRTHRRGRTRRHIVAGTVAALLAGAGAGALALSAGAAPTGAVTVTVDAGTSLGTVPSTGVGLNTAVYDACMNDAEAASLMKAAGIRQLRFPGGSVADAYHWKTHTVTGGSWAAPGTDFDHFMATAKKAGAQPVITANHGSGTPQEAADPFPTYWGIRSLTALARPGDTMVKASSATPSVAVHAVRVGSGGLNVMLINKDPRHAAKVSLTGYAPGTVRTVSYTKGGTALNTAARGTAAAQTLPPYSITTLRLKPSSAATRTGTPSPAPTPTAAAHTAAAPVASASGTIGTRAQATAAGASVPRTDRGGTAGGLAGTGVSDAVAYSALGGLLALAVGCVLVFRPRRGRAAHGR